MRRVRSVGWLALLVTAWARDGRAETNFSVTGVAGGGWTNNPNGAPRNPLPGQPKLRPELFTLTGLTGSLQAETARTYHIAEYRLDFRYGVTSRAPFFTNTATYIGRFRTGEDTTLSLNLNATYAPLNMFSTTQPSSAAPSSSVLPAATTQRVVAVAAGQGLDIKLSDDWKFNQSTTAATLYSVDRDGVPPVSVTERIEARLILPRDTLANTVGAIYFHTPELLTNKAGHILAGGPNATWTHIFSPTFGSELRAGIVFAQDLVRGGTPVAAPTGRAQLGYRGDSATIEGSTAAIFAQREVAPSLLVRAMFVTDEVGVAAGLPLLDEVTLSAFGAIRRGRSILQDPSLPNTPGFLAYAGDVSVTYQPLPELGFTARYQFLHQEFRDAPPGAIPEFTRHTVFALASGTWGTKPRRPQGQEFRGADPGSLRLGSSPF